MFHKLSIIKLVVVSMFTACFFVFVQTGSASANNNYLSNKEIVHLLDKAGYSNEISYKGADRYKLGITVTKRTNQKTFLYSSPGARGRDKFTLTPKGKYVHIHAVLGSMEGNHFKRHSHEFSKSFGPEHKVVKRF
ncbi:hypothetical protein LNP07_04650 [Apilactobacillus sp. M161]|uniref:Extracellular protein n=1 Tax=Apilactobacillus xinyiensis TaxID=2841032 RepID=A0ABT0I267_9LACO|nr:hypothetical protein [Apilactobacillus xinyiensis]MCK8624801.1 hypothetical protein [Apilactobacillus xinyiensis]